VRLAAPTGQGDLVARSLDRDRRPFATRDRLGELTVGTAFVIVAALLLVAHPPTAFPLLPALACVLVLAVATQVHFHVASGYTVPTQLAFVPLLFTVPAWMVPPAVVFALVAGRLPGVVRGRTRPSRLLHCVGNSWFALGAALPFVIAGTEPAQAGAGLLIVALLSQLAADFAASSVRELIETGEGLRAQLRETWVYGVDVALSPVALAVAYEVGDRPGLVLGLLPLLGVLAVFARERQARMENLVELTNAYHGTALVLGDVVEADDGYTGRHCRSVVALAMEVGLALGLDADRRRNLEFGALLHDVGKVAISKEIINKPGKLDPHEFAIVKTHTTEGQKMLDRIGGFMREVGSIVRSHHERWDGGGYPDGLAGEAIPLESRIVACCDTWNAMRTDRPYRRALSHADAVAEMCANAGTQFDPRVVEALLAVVD
jgi:putative nucleotidyltransferase with HDIG domain